MNGRLQNESFPLALAEAVHYVGGGWRGTAACVRTHRRKDREDGTPPREASLRLYICFLGLAG